MTTVRDTPERSSTAQPVEVVDSPGRGRFEAVRDGELLGRVEYQRTDELLVLTHTEVDPSLEGQGVGGALVRAALDQARDQRLRVLPVCPFVQGWMRRHPEYVDLDYRRSGREATD